MSRPRYLRTGDSRPWGAEPGLAPEFVPRTESDEARRNMREWLRDRDETNTDDFEDRGPCGVFGDYDYCESRK